LDKTEGYKAYIKWEHILKKKNNPYNVEYNKKVIMEIVDLIQIDQGNKFVHLMDQ